MLARSAWKLLLGRCHPAPVRCASSDLSAASAQRPCAGGDARAENARLRRNLALSYRLLDRLDLNEGTCNHLTVLAPARDGSGKSVMLLAPGHLPDGSSLHWSEMTASSLLGVNENLEVVSFRVLSRFYIGLLLPRLGSAHQ